MQDLLDKDSAISTMGEGTHPEYETAPVRGWLTGLVAKLDDWHRALEELFPQGLRKRFSEHMPGKENCLLGVLEREFYRLWADTYLLATTFATAITHQAMRKKNGNTTAARSSPPQVGKETQCYFPLVQGNGLDGTSLRSLNATLLHPAFKEATDFYDPGFHLKSELRIPVMVSPAIIEMFAERMTTLMKILGEGLKKPSSVAVTSWENGEPMESTVTFKGSELKIIFSFEGTRGASQARMRMIHIPGFEDLEIRVDHDMYGVTSQYSSTPWLAQLGNPTVDFGSININEMIKGSLEIESMLEQISPYEEQLNPDAEVPGTFRQKRNKPVSRGNGLGSLVNSYENAGKRFLPLMACVVSSGGFLVGTRKKPVVGHHLRWDRPIERGVFAEHGRDLNKLFSEARFAAPQTPNKTQKKHKGS